MQSKHTPIQEYSRYGKPLKPGMWEYLYSYNDDGTPPRKTLADYDLKGNR